MKNVSAKVQALVTDETELPAYAWPGGYPIFYVNQRCEVFCTSCANEIVKEEETDEVITDYDCNWEDSQMYCDQCNNRIESAYAEDEDETEE